MANKAGRPTKLTRDVIEKAREYPKLYAALGDVIPSIEGLCIYLKISRDTAYQWKEIDKRFSDIMSDIMLKQANTLFNGGIKGTFNPTISKLLLSKHGYREGVDVTSDGKAMQVPITYVKPDKK